MKKALKALFFNPIGILVFIYILPVAILIIIKNIRNLEELVAKLEKIEDIIG